MFCPNCGAENSDSTKFCTNCGAPLGAQSQDNGFSQPNSNPAGFDPANSFDPSGNPAGFNPQNGSNGYDFQQGQPAPYFGGAGITGRNIAVAIILSLVTCGIYSIYWFIVLTDETNQLSGRPNDTSGIVSFLLTLITCGIYGWYWAYKLGEKTDAIKNDPSGSSSIIFIILQIFGLGIVNYAIAQDAINKAVNYQ
ncbi:DUF4234 domain-containing protein [Butyrivibrio sp. XPD2002]|jgi:hypothetical protein|uniref:DUF4234 domain-containing protein n=1 Tax=Butyrivibrio sp. XPD2002 TaxID=1280665 RepID=UPI000418A02C|nr:DUF4234 domain-containing protein [Butyrivibrio sp. XPD2002]